MKLTTTISKIVGVILFLLFFTMSSCKKEPTQHAFKGAVYNKEFAPVVNATITIFKSPEDWLTGHNVVATMSSDMIGEFESPALFEEGEYYIFIDKYDTSNWELRDVERGIYPTVSLPMEGGYIETIEHNNMSLLANTRWKLTNILKEFTRNDHSSIEWHSIWANTNNCERDNKLHFGKDLSMRIDEGQTVCSGKEKNILGTFVPPMIFSISGCDKLPNTSQNVKQFEFSGWEHMEKNEAKMYLACDQSIGQIYIYYKHGNDKMRLRVYSREG